MEVGRGYRDDFCKRYRDVFAAAHSASTAGAASSVPLASPQGLEGEKRLAKPCRHGGPSAGTGVAPVRTRVVRLARVLSRAQAVISLTAAVARCLGPWFPITTWALSDLRLRERELGLKAAGQDRLSVTTTGCLRDTDGQLRVSNDGQSPVCCHASGLRYLEDSLFREVVSTHSFLGHFMQAFHGLTFSTGFFNVWGVTWF